MRGKLRKVQHYQLTFKKVKLFKANTASTKEAFKNEFFHLNLIEDCCRERMRENRSSYFIMGTYDGSQLHPTFIMLWEAKRSKVLREKLKMFNNFSKSWDTSRFLCNTWLPRVLWSPKASKIQPPSQLTENALSILMLVKKFYTHFKNVFKISARQGVAKKNKNSIFQGVLWVQIG